MIYYNKLKLYYYLIYNSYLFISYFLINLFIKLSKYNSDFLSKQ